MLWNIGLSFQLFPSQTSPGAKEEETKEVIALRQEHESRVERISAQIWKIQAAQALAVYILPNNVRDTILFHILSMTDPHDMWTCITNMYSDSSEDRRQLLQSRLKDLRMEGQSVEKHLGAINSIVTQLANCGSQLTNALLVHSVLGTLPALWHNF
jgi:hypothetical protein